MTSAIPESEFHRLDWCIGRTCVALRLCLMRDADVEYTSDDPAGLFELTWGVILDFADAPSLGVTWTQDALGNPNRLSLIESEALRAVDSMVTQNASACLPWSSIIGWPCRSVRAYTYRSNYGHSPSGGAWHDVLWGLQFEFPLLSFLVAVAWHGHSDTDPIANDEIVLAYTPDSIARLVALRDNYNEEWRS